MSIFVRYHGGARDGRFMRVSWSAGQPVDALPTTDARLRTEFENKTRARWAIKELKRKGCLAADQSYRLVTVEQLKVEAAARDYVAATGGA